MKYKFNPEDYGFESSDNFEEDFSWYGSNIYIKIIATHETPGMPQRKVFWYVACKMPVIDGIFDDDRIKFYHHAYDSMEPDNWSTSPRVAYFGTISSDDFAKPLLMHIFGTTKNEGVLTDGFERLNMNINHLVKPKIHDNKD